MAAADCANYGNHPSGTDCLECTTADAGRALLAAPDLSDVSKRRYSPIKGASTPRRCLLKRWLFLLLLCARADPPFPTIVSDSRQNPPELTVCESSMA